MDSIENTAAVVARRTLKGIIAGVFASDGSDGLTSVATASLMMELAGVAGDRHYGFTRKAGSREPWYPRGAEIRSGRQVSIVSVEELAEIARRMSLDTLPAEWIGANIALKGVPRLSWLPAGTRMLFDGNASLVVEGINAPCRDAGRSIVRHTGGRSEFELMFAKVALGLRGVVASIERAGSIVAGGTVQVRVPEQRLYA